MRSKGRSILAKAWHDREPAESTKKNEQIEQASSWLLRPHTVTIIRTKSQNFGTRPAYLAAFKLTLSLSIRKIYAIVAVCIELDAMNVHAVFSRLFFLSRDRYITIIPGISFLSIVFTDRQYYRVPQNIWSPRMNFKLCSMNFHCILFFAWCNDRYSLNIDLMIPSLWRFT